MNEAATAAVKEMLLNLASNFCLVNFVHGSYSQPCHRSCFNTRCSWYHYPAVPAIKTAGCIGLYSRRLACKPWLCLIPYSNRGGWYSHLGGDWSYLSSVCIGARIQFQKARVR